MTFRNFIFLNIIFKVILINGLINHNDKIIYKSNIIDKCKYIKTNTGLKYIDIKTHQKNKKPPKIGSIVEINYQAWLDLDQNYIDKGNLIVRLDSGTLIKGIDETLHNMTLNSKRGILVNSENGYKNTGFPTKGDKVGEIIPPNTDVHYILELKSIDKAIIDLNISHLVYYFKMIFHKLLKIIS